MTIKLESIFNNSTNQIEINEDFQIDKERLENTDANDVFNLHFDGKVSELGDELNLVGIVKGTFMLQDAISLEDVPYDFSCEIEENLNDFVQKDQNTIDILEILWQNIVLEIPIKYTLVQDLSKYQGDGWKVVNEDALIRNNPFGELSSIMKEE